MKAVNFKKMRSGGFLVFDPAGGAAVVTRDNWLALPEPLATLVRRATDESDD